jgi:magnesium transporter
MLINCVAYRAGNKLADIDVAAISDYVALPDCFVWVALRDASHEELAQMQHEFDLHDLAVEDAHHGHQRPKIEEYGDTVFAVLQLIEFSPTDELRLGEVHIFAGRNFVLSLRNHSTQNFLGVRERCEREPELLQLGSGFVLYALMDAVVDRYFPVVDALETELEAIESQIFDRNAGKGAGRANIERLYELKHKATTLRHAVVPLADSLGRLYGGRVPAVCATTGDYFRDVGDHLARLQTSIDTIRETITTAIQVNLSMVTIEESEVTKRLAAWAGIFAVATFFVGVWGMNFEHMPELHSPWGYPAALGLIAAVCSLMYWRFRRSGWL